MFDSLSKYQFHALQPRAGHAMDRQSSTAGYWLSGR